MYYQNYEDYMRNILGYPADDYFMGNMYGNSMETSPYPNYYTAQTNATYENTQNNLKDLYPDIYNLVYPMVCKVCQNAPEDITNTTLEKMVDEVYFNFEDDKRQELRINIEASDGKEKNIRNVRNQNQNLRDIEVKEEKRAPRPNNQFLRDLIKILILNQIISRPPKRPPVRPPVRPPFGVAPRYYENF